MNGGSARGASKRRSSGQALVEFSIALIPFVFLLMGVLDFGRGIYVYNGVAQAAREIARVTSVHPGTDFSTTTGQSSQTLAVIATQKGMVPGLADPSSTIAIACTDGSDTVITPASTCASGDYVRVSISVQFGIITPILGLASPLTFSSASHIEIP